LLSSSAKPRTRHQTGRGQLAAYKCPRVYQFRTELPKNALGKVLKDELVRERGGARA
jgi:long-chain acyl-CoA synthetase